MQFSNKALFLIAGGLLVILSLLLSFFAYQQHWFGLNLSTEEKLIRDFKRANVNTNPLLSDLAQQKFSITYSAEDVRAVLPLQNSCSIYIDKEPKLEQALRTNAAIEVLTLADPLTKGIIESGVEKVLGGSDFKLAEAIAPYADYFTGSFLYFINPTKMTESTAHEYIKKYNSHEPMNYLENELVNNENQHRKFAVYACMSLDLYLGALGVDTISKSISKDLVSLTSRANVSNYLDLLEQL